MTSFLIDDFLADNGFFGAHSVVLSSVEQDRLRHGLLPLAATRQLRRRCAPIGLTSPGNLDFTAGLGCYDQVLGYDELQRLPADEPAVYVDFSGSAPLRAAVHGHYCRPPDLQLRGRRNALNDLGRGQVLPDPRPVLFFAPAQSHKRTAEWGVAELQARLAEAWRAFMQPVTHPTHPWLRVERGRRPDAVAAVYADPSTGGPIPG